MFRLGNNKLAMFLSRAASRTSSNHPKKWPPNRRWKPLLHVLELQPPPPHAKLAHNIGRDKNRRLYKLVTVYFNLLQVFSRRFKSAITRGKKGQIHPNMGSSPPKKRRCIKKNCILSANKSHLPVVLERVLDTFSYRF